MKILKSIEAYKPSSKPVVLSLGFFDGVHLGHKQVLQKVNDYKEAIKGRSVVVTFENHPKTVLEPGSPTELLTTTEHRLNLISEKEIDVLILLKFTQELREQTADAFLKKLHSQIPFSHFVLGYDATLGKDRHGNPETMQELEKSLSFKLDYVPEFKLDGESISSSKIRELVKQGKWPSVEKLLGRKFSIYSTVIEGKGLGTKMGYPTANIHIEGLCLPPLGVYAVKIICGESTFNGVANLGIAPTIGKSQSPQLEVFLFDFYNYLYGKPLEIIFHDYLRPEKKFPSIDDLKVQISLDVKNAKRILT